MSATKSLLHGMTVVNKAEKRRNFEAKDDLGVAAGSSGAIIVVEVG